MLRLGGPRDGLAFYEDKKRTFSLRGNPGGALVEGGVDFQDPIHARKGVTVSNGEWEFKVRPITAEKTDALELSILKGGGMQMRSEIKNGGMNLVLAGALIAHGGCKVPAGVAWTEQAPTTGISLNAITYAANQFVALGDKQDGLTSPDGVTWTRRDIIWDGSIINGIAYGAGQFVAAVDNFREIYTSPNGVSWRRRDSGTTYEFESITYGAGQFVAGTVLGEIYTSPDGVTWTKQTSGATNTLTAVTYGAGQFVAGTVLGEIYTSPDGVTWTRQSLGARRSINGIAYGAGLIVAVGRGGLILTSPDGVTWTRRDSGTGQHLRDITYAADKFVAVGERVILTSTDTDIWEQRNKP